MKNILPTLLLPICLAGAVANAQTTVFDHDFENAVSGDLSAGGSIGTPAAGTLTATGGFISDFVPLDAFGSQGRTYTTGNNGASNEIVLPTDEAGVVLEGSYNDVGTPAGNFVTAELSEPAAITGVLGAGQTTTIDFTLASFGTSNNNLFKYVHAIGQSSTGAEVFHVLWRCGSGSGNRQVFAREFGEDNTAYLDTGTVASGGSGESGGVDGTTLLDGLGFDMNSTDSAVTRAGFVSVSITIDENGWNALAINSRGSNTFQEEETGLGIASGATDLASIVFFTSHDSRVSNQNKGMWLDSIVVQTDLTVDPVDPVDGDLNGDGLVDCADIDSYIGNLGLAAVGGLTDLDLVADGTIDSLDVAFLVENLVTTSNGVAGTALGDLNCDGQVNVLGDAFVLVASLNNTVDSYSLGDINLDGSVNVLGDAFALVANLGFSNGL